MSEHSEPEILPFLGEEEMTFDELPLLGEDSDLQTLSRHPHPDTGNAPLDLDMGLDAPHQPHA